MISSPIQFGGENFVPFGGTLAGVRSYERELRPPERIIVVVFHWARIVDARGAPADDLSRTAPSKPI